MRPTQRKDALRNIRRQMVSYLSILVIAMLAVMAYLGIMFGARSIRENGDRFFDTGAFRDTEVISTKLLTPADLDAIRSLAGVAEAEGLWKTTATVFFGGSHTSVDVLSLTSRVNVPILRQGRLPETPGECAVEQELADSLGLACGDTIAITDAKGDTADYLLARSFTVTAIVWHPEYGCTGSVMPGNRVVLLLPEAFDLESLQGCCMRAEIRMERPDGLSRFSRAYDEKTGELAARLEVLGQTRAPLRDGEIRAQYTDEIDAGRSALDTAAADMAEGRRQLEQGEAELRENRAELARAESELSDARRELADGETELAQAWDTLTQGEARLTEGAAQLAEAEALLAEKKAELAQARRTLDDAAGELAAGKEELDRGAAELADSRRILDDAAGELAAGKAELDRGERELADSRRILDDAAEELAAGKDELDRGETELARARTELADAWQKLSEGAPLLTQGEAELAEARAELESGRAELADALAQIEDGRAELAESKPQLDAALQELRRAYVQLMEGQTQLTESYREIEARKESIRECLRLGLREGLILAGVPASEAASAVDAIDWAEESPVPELYGEVPSAAEFRITGDITVTLSKNSYSQTVELVMENFDLLFDRLVALTGSQSLAEKREQVRTAARVALEAAAPLETEYNRAVDQLLAWDKGHARYVAGGDAYLEGYELYQEGLHRYEEGAARLAEAESQYEEGLAAYDRGLAEYEAGLAEYEQKKQEYADGLAKYEQGKETYDLALAAWQEAKATYDAGLRDYRDGEERYAEGLSAWQEAKATYDAGLRDYRDGETRYGEGLTAWQEAKKEYDAGLLDYEAGERAYADGLGQYTRGLEEYDAALADYEAARAEYDRGLADYETGLAAWQEGKQAYEEGLARLEDGRARLAEGEATLAEKETEYADGLARYEEGLARLEEAEAQRSALDPTRWVVLGIEGNGGFLGVRDTAKNVTDMGMTFALPFIIVAALVIYATVGRIVDEQRRLVGATKALGLYNREIFAKYLLFGVSATLAGMVLGVALGYLGIQRILMKAYGSSFVYGSGSPAFRPGLTALVLAGGLALSAATVWSACSDLLRSTAVQLMQEKTPSAGKKRGGGRRVLSLYWRLVLRNMRSDKKRVAVTVVSVAGSCALLVTGFTMRSAVGDALTRQFTDVSVYDAAVSFDPEAFAAAEGEIAALLDQAGADYMVLHSRDLTYTAGGKLNTAILLCGDLAELDRFCIRRDPKSGALLPDGDGGVYIHLRIAERNGLETGDTVTLYDRAMLPHNVQIAGVFNVYASREMILSEAAYRQVFGQTPEHNTFLVRLDSAADETLWQRVAAVPGAMEIRYTADTLAVYRGFAAILDVVAGVLTLAAGMMAYFILLNLANMYVNQKKRELTIMRINGFTLKETIRYVAGEAVATTAVGILLGWGAGSLLARRVVALLENGNTQFLRGIQWMSWVYAAAITLVFSLAIYALALRKVKYLKLTDIA